MWTAMLKKINSLVFVFLILLGGCTASENKNSSFNVVSIMEEIDFALENKELSEKKHWFSNSVNIENFQKEWDQLVTQNGKRAITRYFFEKEGLLLLKIFEAEKTVDLYLWIEEEKITDYKIVLAQEPIFDQFTQEFTEESISVGVMGILSGKLTMPVGVVNPPVVILVPGSGPTNMNSEAYALNPFEDLAHGLARQGIASIRYNKRYYEYPYFSKDSSKITLDLEYIDDLKATLNLVEKYPVDQTQIYILGHSQGGMLVPKLAVENEKVAGIIAIAGTPRGLEEVLRDQNESLLKMSDQYNEKEKEKILGMLDLEIEKIRALKEDDETSIILTLPSGYWYSLNQAKAENFISKLHQDFLILQGDKDFQVSVEKDFEAWKKMVQGMSNVQLKLYPGLNHMMVESDVVGIEDYQKERKVVQGLIDDLVSWIKERKIEGGLSNE